MYVYIYICIYIYIYMYVCIYIYINNISRTTVRLCGLGVPTSRTHFQRIIVMFHYKFWYSQTGESLNLRKKSSKSTWYENA